MGDNEIMIDKGMELGKIFADAGVFPDIKSAAQGYVKILAGRELGLSPMQSINSFYFVGGRMGITANTIAALVKKSERYDYQVIKHDETECSITFYSKDDAALGTSTFTIKDAAKAGIVNGVNWKNYPKNMLFARALMNGVRWYCPDIMNAFTVSVEELGDLSKPDISSKYVTINSNDEVQEQEDPIASASTVEKEATTVR